MSFLKHVLVLGVLDLLRLLFFSTYTLVLFWAEIYHQVSVSYTKDIEWIPSLIAIMGGVYKLYM